MTAAEQPALERAVLDLLAERDAGKTICPSEAARRVEPDAWREQMEPARDAARRLAGAGRIDITQGGEAIDPEGPFHGPIRLRLRG